MDQELKAQLERIEKKVDEAHASAEKARKYIQWMVIITIATIVLPLLALPFAVGNLMSTYQNALNF